MNDKSHVSMERRVCLVCGVEYDTGAILLDRRLQPSLERFTTTGWGLCAEHQRLFDEGYIALVECDPSQSGVTLNTATLKPRDAFRTGRIAHVRREAFDHIFTTPVKENLPCVFVPPDVIDRLQTFVKTH